MTVTPIHDETTPDVDALDDELLCPHCATPYDPGQEYCLECGARLPESRRVGKTLGSAWQRKLGYYPGDWVWPVLIGLLIAGLATAVLIAVASDRSERTTLVATGPTLSVRTQTTSPPTATTGATGATATTPSTTAAQPPPPPPKKTLAQWPTGRNGYTVVLESLPTGGGRAAAVKKAKAAMAKGLKDVGVINSSLYSSLHPGYYVVFSGIFDSLAGATRAEARAQARGYGAAYARQIIS